MSEQPRNATAGQRQKEYQKAAQQKSGQAFANQGLTRKNEEFMFQLNKQLDAQGATADQKTAMIQETMTKVLEAQKSGKTAKGMFGTPTAYANELLHPKKPVDTQINSNLWLVMADNALIFFAIFTFMYGFMAFTSPSTLTSSGHNGTAGIVAIALVSVIGGGLFAWTMKQFEPKVNKDGKAEKRSLGYRIGILLLALVTWIASYGLMTFLPNAINPIVNKWVYIVLAVVSFVGDMYMRNKFNIVSTFFGRPAARRK